MELVKEWAKEKEKKGKVIGRQKDRCEEEKERSMTSQEGKMQVGIALPRFYHFSS